MTADPAPTTTPTTTSTETDPTRGAKAALRRGLRHGKYFVGDHPTLLPILLRALPDLLGLPIRAATVEHLQFMIVGALIIFFLAVEPNGLARLWQVGKQKLRVWPFPY